MPEPPAASDLLLDALADAIAVVDARGTVLRVNAAQARRLGLSGPDAAVARTVPALYPPAEAEAVLAAAAEAIATGAESHEREVRVDGADGTRWLAVRATPVRGGAGDAGGGGGTGGAGGASGTARIEAALVVSRDATPGKRVERSLRDAVAMYESLAEELPMNIFRKDREGRFVFVNRMSSRTLGVAREEMIGKTDHDFSPRALADKFRADDLRVIQTGVAFEDVEEHNPREGEPTHVHVFKAPVRDAAGAVVGVQGFFVDVTHLKRTEASLVRKTAELEAALGQLRAHQEQLLVAEKMASLGRLTAGIAHEMNTPLAAVRSALAELEALVAEYASSAGDPQVGAADHGQIAAEMDRTVRLAQSAAARAAAFVHGVKAHTRDLSPKERRRFGAATAIDEALLLLTHALRHAGVEIAFARPAEDIALLGAPGRLAQVVTNLVNNAIDAMAGRGPGTIRLGLGRDAGASVLEVADTGGGIPADVVGKIFDPMFTTKPFGEGTGLGLTIVHDIVVGDFGGTIDVRTRPGEGTTFVLRFPDR